MNTYNNEIMKNEKKRHSIPLTSQYVVHAQLLMIFFFRIMQPLPHLFVLKIAIKIIE